jgi:creatinine amidohydrolase/Fe(II)-dependent formamide hydrolase-like protein
MSKAKAAGPSPEMGYRTIDMLKQPPFSLVNEFDELSETGVLGMPDLATAEKGERFFEAACNGVFRLLDEMAAWNFQHKLSRAGSHRSA